MHVETLYENDLILIEGKLRFFFFFNSRYDAEANYFDEGVRTAKQKQLQEKLLQVILLKFILAQSCFFFFIFNFM